MGNFMTVQIKSIKMLIKRQYALVHRQLRPKNIRYYKKKQALKNRKRKQEINRNLGDFDHEKHFYKINFQEAMLKILLTKTPSLKMQNSI